ncbi:MAG: hypothetical protein GX299_00915 [Epulopiscium sp.]|jgi:hypothetical protein|nr:hypothetical protein [Candidatus Epulonipiscium sp.]
MESTGKEGGLKGILYCTKNGEQTEVLSLTEEEQRQVCLELHKLCYEALAMQKGYQMTNFKPED